MKTNTGIKIQPKVELRARIPIDLYIELANIKGDVPWTEFMEKILKWVVTAQNAQTSEELKRAAP